LNELLLDLKTLMQSMQSLCLESNHLRVYEESMRIEFTRTEIFSISQLVSGNFHINVALNELFPAFIHTSYLL